ncbi:MAG TPA: non-homologous end-joining DNA ligase [Thermoanaerobaculia bacterium]|nr:non-homologous end-joining DNA ligase [Thermoanaerobaculia bacterium]
MAKDPQIALEADGREVVLTNPDKVFFPKAGYTKRDLAKYYLAVAPGALRGIAGRPIVLKRYVNGADQEPFFQKRAPEKHPDWVETVELKFPSGRTAREVVVRDAAQLLWIVNLGCIDLNPHPVRADDLEHPDELRVDLDPVPGVAFDDIRRVALIARDVLAERGLRGWPKTSGSRGIHVNVRIERRWSFDQVRRAALALAREVERRAPGIATSKWWKEERRGVFLDYNQNAKDRTVASAWSVRPTPDARVSMPLEWEEVADVDPAAFTLVTAPARFAERGDASEGIDASAGSLEGLLALSAEQEAQGLGDAPWPPHYRKQEGEPARVAPSRKKKDSPPETRTPDVVESPTGRRRSTQPLVTVAKARHEVDARAGLERWKARHPEAAARLETDDVLVDAMRGRSSTWTRIRVNLRHVPEAERPEPEPPDPDYDPWRELRERWERERDRVESGSEVRDADDVAASLRRSPSGKSPSRRKSARDSEPRRKPAGKSDRPDPKTRSSS